MLNEFDVYCFFHHHCNKNVRGTQFLKYWRLRSTLIPKGETRKRKWQVKDGVAERVAGGVKWKLLLDATVLKWSFTIQNIKKNSLHSKNSLKSVFINRRLYETLYGRYRGDVGHYHIEKQESCVRFRREGRLALYRVPNPVLKCRAVGVQLVVETVNDRHTRTRIINWKETESKEWIF